MENKRDPVRKGQEKKPSSMNGNVIWYLLGLGVLTLIVVTLFNNNNDVYILPSNLIELVKRTNPEDSAKAKIEVRDGDSVIIYHGLSDLHWGVTKSLERSSRKQTAKVNLFGFTPI